MLYPHFAVFLARHAGCACTYSRPLSDAFAGNATTSNVFTRNSPVCKAMLEKGYVSPIFGGCAIVRARPDTPKPSVADTMNRIVNTLLRSSGTKTDDISEQSSLSTGDSAGSPTGARSLKLTSDGMESRAEPAVQSGASSEQWGVHEEEDSAQDKHIGDAVAGAPVEGNGTGATNGDIPAAPDNYAIEIGACNSKHCVELSFTVLWVALLMLLLLLVLSPPKPVFYSALMIVGYWYGMLANQSRP